MVDHKMYFILIHYDKILSRNITVLFSLSIAWELINVLLAKKFIHFKVRGVIIRLEFT